MYRSIDASLVAEFQHKGLLYVRNYADVDLPWQEVFQTTDREVVTAYCKANDIQAEWLADGTLRTKQLGRWAVNHPVVGKPLWFNQAHLFHVSSLSAENQRNLISTFGENRLPRNVYFSDGSPIPTEALEHIRSIYQEQQISFDWQRHDLLLLDNMLFTHGRRPFTGHRKVLVGMARSCNAATIDSATQSAA